MIPAYSKPVEIKALSEDLTKRPIEEQVRMLQEQVAQLRETIDYYNRERTRLKNEVDQLKSAFNKN